MITYKNDALEAVPDWINSRHPQNKKAPNEMRVEEYIIQLQEEAGQLRATAIFLGVALAGATCLCLALQEGIL